MLPLNFTTQNVLLNFWFLILDNYILLFEPSFTRLVSYTCTHAVTSIQLQITPCTAQVAGHPRMQSHPAELRETSTTILAAKLKCLNRSPFTDFHHL